MIGTTTVEDAGSQTGSEVERAVMIVLLGGTLLSCGEVVREVARCDGEQVEVRDAIESLRCAGLVHLIDGQFLLASRAARRADGLGL